MRGTKRWFSRSSRASWRSCGRSSTNKALFTNISTARRGTGSWARWRVRKMTTQAVLPHRLLKAGGLVLSLTATAYVFLLDPWWNPATLKAGHRPGAPDRADAAGFRVSADRAGYGRGKSFAASAEQARSRGRDHQRGQRANQQTWARRPGTSSLVSQTHTITQWLQIAMDHHNHGRLREAEQIYRGILSKRPEQCGCSTSSGQYWQAPKNFPGKHLI